MERTPKAFGVAHLILVKRSCAHSERSPMSASDQHQTSEVAWRRNPVVRRLAQCLTVGLLVAGALWFSPLWLGRSGTRAFAACLAVVTVLAVVTFLAALATGDISVALGSGFALALAAIYWFIAISFGMTDLVRVRGSMPIVFSKSPNPAMERTPDRSAIKFEMTSSLPLRATHGLVRRRSSYSR